MTLDAMLARFDSDRALVAQVVELGRTWTASTDPSHDWLHVERVTELASQIACREGAHLLVTVAAALLHELVSFPKSHPEAHRGAEQCAMVAEHLLRRIGFATDLAARVAVCIEEHPFSRQVQPSTLESAVLQDADRLDAIGAVGVARCFGTSGALGRPFYVEDDPFCRNRQPDDRLSALDHFSSKLLRLAQELHTPAARALAEPRVRAMLSWLDAFEKEIAATTS